ncbi:N-acetyltransferase [Paraburkholderia terrae]|uniref:N-acetyltransferase n=2 Tax=Paraburkholderia terrae TaxID=311230 RepID=A0A2I8EWP3_9BURK|nr:N-acetyltransferase [Paraburkholderia terrae]
MKTVRVNIRAAMSADIAALIELDSIAQRSLQRRAYIENAAIATQCWLATEPGDGASPVGYGVLNQNFFEHDFVSLIVVGEESRRRGIGIAILRELETQCRGPKLFTSTNESNTPMRALLSQCGFVESGYIDNLDEGDRELIFVKRTSA